MSNLGFASLRVVNPFEASFREARSAVGAAPLLKRAQEFTSVADAVADCSLVIGTTAAQKRELQQPLKTLQEVASLIRRRLRTGRVALLFGSEKRGLSNDDLSHCHWLLHIPTRADHRSMNLGQAVAVCLYELGRTDRGGAPRSRMARAAEGKAADAGELERIITMLMDALRTSGYLKPQAAAAQEEKIRRMILRLELSAGDAAVWQGMLRQIVWKLKS